MRKWRCPFFNKWRKLWIVRKIWFFHKYIWKGFSKIWKKL